MCLNYQFTILISRANQTTTEYLCKLHLIKEISTTAQMQVVFIISLPINFQYNLGRPYSILKTHIMKNSIDHNRLNEK